MGSEKESYPTSPQTWPPSPVPLSSPITSLMIVTFITYFSPKSSNIGNISPDNKVCSLCRRITVRTVIRFRLFVVLHCRSEVPFPYRRGAIIRCRFPPLPYLPLSLSTRYENYTFGIKKIMFIKLYVIIVTYCMQL